MTTGLSEQVTMGFTEYQLGLICTLENVGYGWGKFAASVRLQGWCSTRQEETLTSMLCRVRSRKRTSTTAPMPTDNIGRTASDHRDTWDDSFPDGCGPDD